MKKRVNPRHRPVNAADVKRAKNAATEEAMRRVILMFLYVLVDKHNAPKEDIQQVAKELNYLADSIGKGYVKWPDIERVLLDEYDVEIEMT